MNATTLRAHIDEHHGGCQRTFAAAVGVKPQQVTKWLRMGCVVVDGVLYSARRDITQTSADSAGVGE